MAESIILPSGFESEIVSPRPVIIQLSSRITALSCGSKILISGFIPSTQILSSRIKTRSSPIVSNLQRLKLIGSFPVLCNSTQSSAGETEPSLQYGSISVIFKSSEPIYSGHCGFSCPGVGQADCTQSVPVEALRPSIPAPACIDVGSINDSPSTVLVQETLWMSTPLPLAKLITSEVVCLR